MDTTKYQLIYTSPKHGNFYTAIDPNGYHLSRYIAAGVQNIYSGAGSTKEYLEAITEQMLEIINTGNKGKIISDLSVLVNNIRYRLSSPVDADAAIRMGAIYVLHEDEPTDEVNAGWTSKKMKMVLDDRELYELFFSEGVKYTPSWIEALSDSEEMSLYLKRREQALASLSIPLQ